MKSCWGSREQKSERNIACVVGMLIGIFIVSVSLYDSYIKLNENEISVLNVVMILAGIILMGSVTFYYIIASREYGVESDGITVRYLKKYSLKYLWNEITEVSICDVHHATKGPAFNMVIRIVIGKEKNGPSNLKCSINPLNGYEHWRSDLYDMKHYRQIIVIEYNQARLMEIREKSGKEIKDYRTKKGKKYAIEI